jgi:hypothetical protein
MNASQIVAVISPLALGGATLLVHYLAPTTVAEIGTVLGLAVSVLTGVRNVFVTAPGDVPKEEITKRELS